MKDEKKIIQQFILSATGSKELLLEIQRLLKTRKLLFPEEDDKYEKEFVELFNSTVENLDRSIKDGQNWITNQN